MHPQGNEMLLHPCMDMPIPSALYAIQVREGGQSCPQLLITLCPSPAIPQEDYVLTQEETGAGSTAIKYSFRDSDLP